MKNRNEITTFMQLSYRTFTILKYFFVTIFISSLEKIKKAPFEELFIFNKKN
jgi:hypothetical protein